jgi:predicted nucleic acid-binding protein
LSRLSDDQSQNRVRQEAEAIERILAGVREGAIEWVGSGAVAAEIANPNAEQRSANAALLAFASEMVRVNDAIKRRAQELNDAGYSAADAFHLACAEAASVDVLLTTDDGLIRKAARAVGTPRVTVRNPLSWVQEHKP